MTINVNITPDTSPEEVPQPPDPSCRYWVGNVACGICSHEWVAVVEIGPDDSEPIAHLECPYCGHMAGGPA